MALLVLDVFMAGGSTETPKSYLGLNVPPFPELLEGAMPRNDDSGVGEKIEALNCSLCRFSVLRHRALVALRPKRRPPFPQVLPLLCAAAGIEP